MQRLVDRASETPLPRLLRFIIMSVFDPANVLEILKPSSQLASKQLVTAWNISVITCGLSVFFSLA
jgi:hypothetical protein